MIVVDNPEALRDWLKEELEPVCDADPAVLAKYILALIKRDKDEEVLRTKCLTSLDVFLAKETTAFVDKLIHALVTQSYIQEEYDPTDWNAPVAVKEETHEESKEEKHASETDQVDGRDVEDEDDEKNGDDEVPPGEEDNRKDYKDLKRERSLSSISSASDLRRSRSKSESKDKTGSKSKNKKRTTRRQVVDDRPRRKKRKDDKGVKRKRKERAKKCPDYEEKGFCKKGDACPFDHGSDPFKVDKLPTEPFMPPMFPSTFAPFPPPGMPFPFPPPGLLNIPPPGFEMFAKNQPTFHNAIQQDRAPKRQASDNIISLTQSRPYNNGNSNGKRPKYTPWNKGKGTPDNTTLELRRIPFEMNTEQKLREHFVRFGEVEAVTVGVADDMQAALVKFANHASARSACSAPEPVFNNRFIAVFWHAGATPLSSTNGNPPLNSQISTESNTGASTESAANFQQNLLKKPAATRAQRMALAKSYMLGGNPAAVQAQIEAQEALKQQKIDSSLKQIQAQEEARKKKEEERKSAIKLKTSLIEQRRELLSKYVEEQKKLLVKLEKEKATMSASSKKLILDTMKSLEDSCAKLRTEIDQLLNAAKPKPKPVPPPKPPPPPSAKLTCSPLMKHKRDTQKELLDAELELLTDKNNEEKIRLEKRLIELKKEAVNLGVLGRGKFPLVPGSLASSAVSPSFQPGFSSFLNPRSRAPTYAAQTNISSPTQQPPTVDTRPKIIKVSGFELEEKDEVIQHFSRLGKVESKWEEGGVLFFEYRNRVDSSNAAQKGFKFKNKTLTVHWHRGPHRNSSVSLDDSGTTSVNNSSATSNSNLSNSFITGGGGGTSSPVASLETLKAKCDSSRESRLSEFLTEDDEEEAERLWRMTANVTY